MKGQNNAGQLKKVHELIDIVEKSGKKLALYEKVFLELMVTNYKYIRSREEVKGKGNKCYVLGTFKNKDDAEFFVDKLAELTNAKGSDENE